MAAIWVSLNFDFFIFEPPARKRVQLIIGHAELGSKGTRFACLQLERCLGLPCSYGAEGLQFAKGICDLHSYDLGGIAARFREACPLRIAETSLSVNEESFRRGAEPGSALIHSG